jgi:hypothetical protein
VTVLHTSKRLHTSGRAVCGTRCAMRRIVKHAVVTVVPSCSIVQRTNVAGAANLWPATGTDINAMPRL